MLKRQGIRLNADLARRALGEVVDVVSKSEREVLIRLIELLDATRSETTVAAALTAIYGPFEDAHLARFRTFRRRLQEATDHLNGLRIGVDVAKNRPNDRRSLWFEAHPTAVEGWDVRGIEASVLGHRSDRVVAQGGLMLDDDGRPIRKVGFIFDPHDAKAAKPFLDKLRIQAATLRDSRGRGIHWQVITPDVEVGRAVVEGWANVAECDLVFIWLSAAFLNPNSVTRRMVEAQTLHRRALVSLLPVDLDDRRQDLGQFEFLTMLGQELTSMPRSARRKEALLTLAMDHLARVPTAEEQPDRDNIADRLINSLDTTIECRETLVPSMATHHQTLDELRFPATSSVGSDALELLKAWRDSPDGTPYFAVLGEAGIGKTTLLRQFATVSGEDRQDTPTIPHVIYLDLRNYSATIARREVPSAESFLDELLATSWKSADQRRLTAGRLIELVNDGAILIMDGLDEKLTHLNPVQGQALIQQIWSIAPPYLDQRTKKRIAKGRIIVSCRSHFFSTLREQNAFLTAQGRDNIGGSDYQAMILLPFSETQVREYFVKAIGEDRADSAIETLRTIHDLSELSRRPLLLSFIAPEIEQLERLRAEGQRIRSIDLYRNLVSEWIARDDGKHQIEQDDKRRLMPRLARDMWREGAREWSWSKVNQWFKLQLASDRTFIYHQDRLNVLQEDLRNATFIVRDERSEDIFRFAHTSLQEFFLAQALFEDLTSPEESGAAWSGALPSDETFAFLAEMLDEHPIHRQAIVRLIETSSGEATRTAMRFFLLARERPWPFPQPARFALAGLDFYRWRFIGIPESPLDLSYADLNHADLTATDWKHVSLRGATLTKADATSATFVNVDLMDAKLEGLLDQDSIWRHCTITKVLSDSKGRHSRVPDRKKGLRLQGKLTALSLVRSIAASSDGRRAIALTLLGTVHVWDFETDNTLAYIHIPNRFIIGAALSQNGTSLIALQRDGTLTEHDLGSGQILRHTTGPVARARVLSLDGTRAASFNSHTLTVWDTDSGAVLMTMKPGHKIRTLAFSPDAKVLACDSGEGSIYLWDVQSANVVQTIPAERAAAISFSSDGTTIASVALTGLTIVWDVTSGDQLASFVSVSNPIFKAALSSDGRRLVSVERGGTLRSWNAGSGEMQHLIKGASGTDTAFSHQDTRIICASRATGFNQWDVRKGRWLRGLKNWTMPISNVSFSPDSTMLISTGQNGSSVLWDSATGLVLGEPEAGRQIKSAYFSPDGKRVLSILRGGGLSLWELKADKDSLKLGTSESMKCVTFSSDGNRVLSLSDSGDLTVFDVSTGKSLSSKNVVAATNRAEFSPDGTCIVSISPRGTEVINIESGQLLLSIENNCSAAKFSPDGKRLLISRTGQLLVIDIATRQTLISTRTPERQAGGYFSHNGMGLVTASRAGHLTCWDIGSGRAVRTLEGHWAAATSVAFSHDGSKLVSGSEDGTIIQWDASSGKALLRFVHGNKETRAAFDHVKEEFLYYGDDSWRAIGFVGYDLKGELQWFMPEEAETSESIVYKPKPGRRPLTNTNEIPTPP